ncbi:MAG: hypothetical protein C5B51_30410 [Terriglobia bacterium]|nr:MAG: hypothetical protein C5B51_30410 [Terriglobia bacterium]
MPSDKKPSTWYCPETGEVLEHAQRRFLARRSAAGYRVVPLQEPGLSSDIAFLWGAYLGIMVAAALLYVSGYLIIRGANGLLAALGYVLLAIGFSLPLYWGISTILLGRKCTKREKPAGGSVPPLPYRIGWVMAAKGTGIVCGTAVVLAAALFLMVSGTASYIY